LAGALLSFLFKRREVDFVYRLLFVTLAHGFKQRLPKFDELAVAVEDVDTEAGIEINEALLLPSRNRPSVASALLVRPGRHPFAIGANVATVRGADAHLEAFDAGNLHFERSDFHREFAPYRAIAAIAILERSNGAIVASKTEGAGVVWRVKNYRADWIRTSDL
jgi:hypothetical protein